MCVCAVQTEIETHMVKFSNGSAKSFKNPLSCSEEGRICVLKCLI